MLIAIDVGNTQTVIGIYAADVLKRHWRISTYPRKTSDEWAVTLSELITINSGTLKELDAAVISSVVPEVTQALEAMCAKTLNIKPLIVAPGIETGISIMTEDPTAVGADRIANATATYAEYGGPAVVVDFGTATTFDVISADGEYLGGAIVPGLEISLDALFARAARLSEIDIEFPERVIGKNTVESLRSGIVYGYAGQIDAMVDRIAEELGAGGKGLKVIATGGLADKVLQACRTVTVHDPTLTLKGLKLIWDKNQS